MTDIRYFEISKSEIPIQILGMKSEYYLYEPACSFIETL